MIVTICGSMTALKEMSYCKDYLVEKGHTVYTPEPFITEEEVEQEHGREYLLKMKLFFTKRHYDKIEKADVVFIVNPEKKGFHGYIGSNTLMELAVAMYLEKKIVLLQTPSEEQPNYEELAGLEATVLEGNLDLIN